MDKNGYCIEYRETLEAHFWRVGNFLEPEPKPITMWDMGVEYAVDLYGVGKCGEFGDNWKEKPPFDEPVEVVKWDAWTKYKGVP